ncbi:phosphatase PAP2 family protein [Terriglobus sp. RCC_193]|uniref:phosphatase PAP2 family protein n=1 Tax=Terriglobus sp. RCC_193 TaxID=3239218 RepID=UPI0035240634
MASDAVHIFISPAYLRPRDLTWLLPLAGASGAAFATDTHTMRDVVSRNPGFNQTATNVSDGLLYTSIATPIGMYAWGRIKSDERSRETGILGSQALVEAYAVGELVKVATFRERPNVDNARGDFFSSTSKLDSSFVSGHSLIAWSSAAVIAGEYHNPWAQLGVYTAATGVSLTRVLGQQHFPSDVLIGSSVGWLIGHYVYRAHHHVPRTK